MKKIVGVIALFFSATSSLASPNFDSKMWPTSCGHGHSFMAKNLVISFYLVPNFLLSKQAGGVLDHEIYFNLKGVNEIAYQEYEVDGKRETFEEWDLLGIRFATDEKSMEDCAIVATKAVMSKKSMTIKIANGASMLHYSSCPGTATMIQSNEQAPIECSLAE